MLVTVDLVTLLGTSKLLLLQDFLQVFLPYHIKQKLKRENKLNWCIFHLLFRLKSLRDFLFGHADLIFNATLSFLFLIVSHVVIGLFVLKEKIVLA